MADYQIFEEIYLNMFNGWELPEIIKDKIRKLKKELDCNKVLVQQVTFMEEDKFLVTFNIFL